MSGDLISVLLLLTAGLFVWAQAPSQLAVIRADTAMKIQSSAFAAGQTIPRQYTADGQNVSPALSWESLPSGTKELALIVDDPDAPTPQPWVHWVIYKIRPDATGLPQGVSREGKLTAPAGALQGRNSWDKLGYFGPDPPRGRVHHYHFQLYALDSSLQLESGADKNALLKAAGGHILGEAEVVGTYQR